MVSADSTETPGMSYSSLRSSGRVVASKSWKATPPGCSSTARP